MVYSPAILSLQLQPVAENSSAPDQSTQDLQCTSKFCCFLREEIMATTEYRRRLNRASRLDETESLVEALVPRVRRVRRTFDSYRDLEDLDQQVADRAYAGLWERTFACVCVLAGPVACVQFKDPIAYTHLGGTSAFQTVQRASNTVVSLHHEGGNCTLRSKLAKVDDMLRCVYFCDGLGFVLVIWEFE